LVEGETFLHDQVGVRIMLHIFVLNGVLLQQIADQTVEERNIRAGPNRSIHVGDRRRSRETRIDDNELRAILDLGFDHPLETAWMRLGGVAAHHKHYVGVLDVLPRVGHRTATECWGQTGHRRSVSDTRLIVEDDHPQRSRDLPRQIGGLG
jgi:hypothetical protein